MLYAVGAIYSKRLVGYPPLIIATMQMICGSLITVPLALLWDKPWTLAVPSRAVVLAVSGTAIIGSSLAAITYFHVLRRAGATNAMLVTLLVPVTPILLGGCPVWRTVVAARDRRRAGDCGGAAGDRRPHRPVSAHDASLRGEHDDGDHGTAEQCDRGRPVDGRRARCRFR